MFSTEKIREIIEKGETGQVEFKSEKEKNIDFAKEIAAFANSSGGCFLVGVEDDGTVSGVNNPLKFEEKIYNICSDSIRSVVTPELWKYKIEERDVFCFYVSPGFSKPYAILQRGRERYYTRRGTRIQEAGRDELIRLFQTSGQIHYEVTPIIKGRYADLDFTRIVDFFRHNQINKIDISSWKDAEIKRFLKNKEVLVEYQGKVCPTIAGALLFGKKPSYLLGYSGITVAKFADIERDYNYLDFHLDKPIMNTSFENGEKEKSGLIEEALEKIKSIIFEKSSAVLKGAVRVVDYPYPEESIREAVVNAVAHRDYTVSGIDIRVDIYPDRLEIESPGKLPNTISLESIRLGAKYYRNQILVQYLKEAGFMDLHSLGIPVKILKLCTEYTGREPELTESENSFKITFYPKRKTTASKVEEEILKLLRTSAEPMKTREISVVLGVLKRTINNRINRLIDSNLVKPTSKNRNDPNCRYRLKQ